MTLITSPESAVHPVAVHPAAALIVAALITTVLIVAALITAVLITAVLITGPVAAVQECSTVTPAARRVSIATLLEAAATPAMRSTSTRTVRPVALASSAEASTQ